MTRSQTPIEQPAGQCAALSVTHGSLPSPRFIRFETPLTQPECEALIEYLYEGKKPPLWGNPMRLGPTKWHVYGCDRKHWKTSNLEITASVITAVFPEMGDALETRLRELVASRHPILANHMICESHENLKP